MVAVLPIPPSLSWVAVRKLGGSTYISAGGATGFELAGTIVGSFVGVGVAVLSLGLYIAANNRANRREEQAKDERHRDEVQKAFDRGWRMRGEIGPREGDDR